MNLFAKGFTSSFGLFRQTTFTPTKMMNLYGALSLQCHRPKSTSKVPYPELHAVSQSAAAQTGTGKVFDKKPFKFHCEEGKSYMWCACGWSHKQPFCDGTHKNPLMKITMRPIRFVCPETKEYWFCNCKQTKRRPFCDGTHKNQEIQAAIKS